jgi:hypothetical protein
MGKLLSDDEQYRDYFKRIWVDVMNHRLTRDFLAERYQHYHRIAVTYGVSDRDYLPKLDTFLVERPSVVRKLAEEYLQTPTVDCRISTRWPVTLDGHPVTSGFAGYYFRNMPVTLDVPHDRADRFLRWQINGAPQPEGQRSLTITADRNLTITAEWR